jgi:RimJ/RimL family protein N-acetyltransferase
MTPEKSAETLQPVVLEGRWVRLEPLTLAHVPDLSHVAFDDDIWRWTVDYLANVSDLEDFVQRALGAQRTGAALPFATVDRSSGRAIGSTRFAQFEPADSRIEIGWTWIGREWQRTAVNTEAKLLMLSHAFDKLRLRRVELKTDALNARSRRAIARLGAVEEGTLRQHTATRRGRIRDTVYYSILATEWPAVRAALEAKLTAHTGTA